MLRVSVIVNGKFHAFDYAAELNKNGHLHQLISSMPYSVAKKYGIPRSKYVGMPFFEGLKLIYRKILKRNPPALTYAKLFTSCANLFLDCETDLIVSFAGYSKEIFEAKKNKSKYKILDRGSTHTLENTKLKFEAANYHGTTFIPHKNQFIERELQEYQMADKIMVPSTFVANTFLINGISQNKLLLNPFGISEKKFSGMELNEKKSSSNTILFVGQVSPRKGIKVLIDAFELVRKQIPGATLWIIGPLNGIKKKNLNKKGVIYYGVKKGKALFDKYSMADVFALPSFEEGLALVLTEAQFFGMPIVATRNSGVEDLYIGINEKEKNFYLVELANPIDLADKLVLALKDNKRITRINSKRGWDVFVEKILNTYETTL